MNGVCALGLDARGRRASSRAGTCRNTLVSFLAKALVAVELVDVEPQIVRVPCYNNARSNWNTAAEMSPRTKHDDDLDGCARVVKGNSRKHHTFGWDPARLLVG